MQSKWGAIFALTISMLILSMNHIFNGFPLLLADSKGYLQRAYFLIESSHWSNTYTLFLASIFKIFGSIHFVAIIQNLLAVSVLFIFSKKFVPKFSNLKFIGIISMLFFSSITWISTMIMSDIFTPLSILCIILLIEKNLNEKELFVIVPILFLSMSAHQSHILIIPSLLASLFLSKAIFKKNRNKSLIKKGLALFLLFIFSNIFEKNILNIISVKENKEISDQSIVKNDIFSGYYFFAVRIAESNKLQSLLSTFCNSSNKNYLCEETGRYDASRVNMVHASKRNENNKEYFQFAKDNKDFVLYSLTKLTTYIGITQLAIKKGLFLLTQTKVRVYQELNGYQHNRMINFIERINSKDLKYYKSSKQVNNEYLSFRQNTYMRYLPIWWKFLFPIALLSFLFLVIKQSPHTKNISLFVIAFLLLGHFFNTMICGTFSNFENVRYSSRTLWLVNFAIIMIFANLYEYYQIGKQSKSHTSSFHNHLSTNSI